MANKDWTKTKAYGDLRKSMLENLRSRGLEEKLYTDKVEEYLAFWVQLKQLHADIKERGITVMDHKREMLVENRSVSLEVQVSRQMLAIWTALGLKDDACDPSRCQGADDDEL